MADPAPHPSLKELQGERNRLWAAARLRGLAPGTPERDRIAELDAQIGARKEKTPKVRRPGAAPPSD